MGYRDDGEAQMYRVQVLELEVAEAREDAAGLRQSLAEAKAEIDLLRENQIEAPERPGELSTEAKRWLIRGLMGASAAALLLLVVAGYSSETDGVAAARLTLPLCGATIGAWARRRRPLNGVLLAAAAAGICSFCSVHYFFDTVWKRL